MQQRKHQHGIALAASLIFLIVLTLLGVTALQSTTLEERMVGNMRDLNLAFQAAEAALREGESQLEAASLPDFDTTIGWYRLVSLGETPFWERDSTWDSSGSTTYTDDLAPVANPPRYIVEEMPVIPGSEGSLASDQPLPDVQMYRVTARASGGSDSAQVMLQSYYKR